MRRKMTRLATLVVLIAATAALVPARAEAQNQGMINPADFQAAQEEYQTQLQRQAIAQNKPAFVADLMSRWSAEIGNTEKGRVGFESAFKAANPEKLLKASQAKTWEAVLNILLGFDPNTNALSSLTGDLVFNPLLPCRVMDTRYGTGVWAGPHTGGSSVSFYVTDNLNANGHTQGGLAACGFPFAVGVGVALNITVVPVGGTTGDLRILPYGGIVPNASIINFTNGTALANAADVQTALSNSTNDVTFQVDGNTSAYIIVDILGYYAAPNATALQNTRVASAATVAANGTFYNPLDSPTCPTGFTLVGGGYNETVVNSGLWVWQNSPGDNPPTFWRFRGYNNSGTSTSVTVYGDCARVPGR